MRSFGNSSAPAVLLQVPGQKAAEWIFRSFFPAMGKRACIERERFGRSELLCGERI